MIKQRKPFLTGTIDDIYLIGVGGTGGFFAQGLAKMLVGYQHKADVTLVDPDIVEENNCIRQNFWQYEIGQPKSEALAFRLNQQFGVSFSYEVATADEVHIKPGWRRMIISCVDNIEARKKLNYEGSWLDMGNDITTGQAIFGSTSRKEILQDAVRDWDKAAHALALPNVFKVAKLSKLKDKKQAPSCAEHPFAEQGVFVNEFAAAAGLIIAHQAIIKNTVTTPQIYFDIHTGRMSPKFITKEIFER